MIALHEAERSVIGALILVTERIPEIADILDEDDFVSARHQALYGAILEVWRAFLAGRRSGGT